MSTLQGAERIDQDALRGRGLLTEQQAAEFLGLSARTLRDWRWKGLGPRYIKLSASRQGGVRYRPTDLDQWITARECDSTSA